MYIGIMEKWKLQFRVQGLRVQGFRVYGPRTVRVKAEDLGAT